MPLAHPNLRDASRLMRLRGISQATIAAEVKTGRAYVSRVLCGYERAGRTWERIRAVLPADIVALLEAVPVPPGARPRRERSMSAIAIATRAKRGRPLPGDAAAALRFASVREAIAALPTFSRAPQGDKCAQASDHHTIPSRDRAQSGIIRDNAAASKVCPMSDLPGSATGSRPAESDSSPRQAVSPTAVAFTHWKQRKTA